MQKFVKIHYLPFTYLHITWIVLCRTYFGFWYIYVCWGWQVHFLHRIVLEDKDKSFANIIAFIPRLPSTGYCIIKHGNEFNPCVYVIGRNKARTTLNRGSVFKVMVFKGFWLIDKEVVVGNAVKYSSCD